MVYFRCFGSSEFFPATETPGVRSVTTFVLQKSTFQPRKLRASPARYIVLQKSTFQPRKLSSHGSSGRPQRTTPVLQKPTFQPQTLRASAAYYICTTKVDFPATEAPGVRGVLHLYYKSRPATAAPGVPGVLRLYYKSRLSRLRYARSPQRVRGSVPKFAKTHSGSAPTGTLCGGARFSSNQDGLLGPMITIINPIKGLF